MCVCLCVHECECCTEVNLDWNLITDSVWVSVYVHVRYLFQCSVCVCARAIDEAEHILHISPLL